MLLDQGIFAVEGDGVEIKIERISPLETKFPHGIEPELQELWITFGINAAAVFGERGSLGNAVESGEDGETFVENVTHGMAVSSIAKEFQSKKRSHGMSGRDHLGAGKPCLLKQPVERYPGKVGQK